MMQLTQAKLKNNVIGFLILPVIFSYKIVLHLLGKPHYYVWGRCDVTVSEPLSNNEYLLMRISPIFTVNLLLGVIILLTLIPEAT
ncbi:hypothetical protein QUF64_01580 [Anaerolineales bacterium HSG6]|nr:hypothetical protein [Anaerolineales bacterium HSG6]